MTKTFFADNANLMSPRRAKYVEAMIREGDGFHYDEWLKKVRKEEAEAKQIEATGIPEPPAAEINEPKSTTDDQRARPNSAIAIRIQNNARTKSASSSPLPSENSKGSTETMAGKGVSRPARVSSKSCARCRLWILRCLFHHCNALQSAATHHQMLRHAFEFADLRFDENADPFSAVIRCTCDNAVDNKIISKWSRALRYASRRKEPNMGLKRFMKEVGGVNACADGRARARRDK